MSLQLYIDDEKYLSREEGRQEGREEGREEGRQEGEQIGLQKERISLIRKQLNKGRDIAFIVDVMDIDTEFVESVVKLIDDNPDMSDSDILAMVTDK